MHLFSVYYEGMEAGEWFLLVVGVTFLLSQTSWFVREHASGLLVLFCASLGLISVDSVYCAGWRFLWDP